MEREQICPDEAGKNRTEATPADVNKVLRIIIAC